MPACIDVQVHAQQYPCAAPDTSGELIDDLDLLRGLDVEREDPLFERVQDLIIPFPDAAEGAPVGRETLLEGAPEFTTRSHIGAEPFARDEAQQRRVRVRLHRIVGQMGEAVEGVLDPPDIIQDRLFAVDIQRRAVRSGKVVEGNILDEESFLPESIRAHGRRPLLRDGSGNIVKSRVHSHRHGTHR